MRCNCCDRVLGPKEISFNKSIGAFEMCGTCLTISLEAAFSDGFKPSEDEDAQIDPDVDEGLASISDADTEFSSVSSFMREVGISAVPDLDYD